MASDQDEPSDRRRAARIPINAEFATTPMATHISDLSEYGVFVHTPTPSPRGTKLKLRFTVLLDDPVIVEGEGRVVRQQYEPISGMGIEFTELAPEMILRVNDVLSRQRPRDSGPPLSSHDEDTDTLDAAQTLTRGDTADDAFDTAQTRRRGGAADSSSSLSRSPSASSSGSFRPPPMPSLADENAKTAIYQPVEDADDPE
jgi:hypothetical protein